MDVSCLSFNTLLLLERVQLSWFPDWVSKKVTDRDWSLAFGANPTVEWYLRHKCPDLGPWIDKVMEHRGQPAAINEVRAAEISILQAIEDLVVYSVDPTVYDAQSFMGWDSNELVSLVDFTGKTVIDVGSGTGRLALVAAEKAAAVFAMEPVANLRHYLKGKARSSGLANVYPVDGLITDIPFPDGFADVTMSGHVYGDHPEDEHREIVRVTKPGGLVILCPGSSKRENAAHDYLVSQGYRWSWFEEPKDRAGRNGSKRKYWKQV